MSTELVSKESVFNAGRVAGVLLAAGRSARMGRPKQLAPLGGQALSEHAAGALAEAGFGFLLAVIPPDKTGEQLRALLSELGFACVINPEPQRGLASSFRVAAQALQMRPELSAAQFALADMPFVTAQTHRAVRDEFERSGAAGVLTRYGPRTQAPPTLLRADLWPELLALPDEDQGPREVIRRRAANVRTVERPEAELLDVDTPELLALAQARWNAAQGR